MEIEATTRIALLDHLFGFGLVITLGNGMDSISVDQNVSRFIIESSDFLQYERKRCVSSSFFTF